MGYILHIKFRLETTFKSVERFALFVLLYYAEELTCTNTHKLVYRS